MRNKKNLVLGGAQFGHSYGLNKFQNSKTAEKKKKILWRLKCVFLD